MIPSSCPCISCDTIGCLKPADFVRLNPDDGGQDDFLCTDCFENRGASFPETVRDFHPLQTLRSGEMERANIPLKKSRKAGSETAKTGSAHLTPSGRSFDHCSRLLRKLERYLYQKDENVRSLPA